MSENDSSWMDPGDSMFDGHGGPPCIVLRPQHAVFTFPDTFYLVLRYLKPFALRARPGKKIRHKERHRQFFRSQFR